MVGLDQHQPAVLQHALEVDGCCSRLRHRNWSWSRGLDLDLNRCWRNINRYGDRWFNRSGFQRRG